MAWPIGISGVIGSAIKAGLRSGFSGRRILASIREQGLRIRNETFFTATRHFREEIERELSFRQMTPDRILNNRTTRALTQSGQTRFAAKFELKFENLATDEIDTRYVTFNFSEPERLGDLMNRVRALQEEDETRKYQTEFFQGRVLNISLVDAYRRIPPPATGAV